MGEQEKHFGYSPATVLIEKELPSPMVRLVIYALVEQREKLLTNRFFVLDAVFSNGRSVSFVQGYCGGGAFTESTFIGERLLLECSDAFAEEDQDFTPDELDRSNIEVFNRLWGSLTLADGICQFDEDSDTYRYESLNDFVLAETHQIAPLWVQCRVWVSDSVSADIVNSDRSRFECLIRKSGVSMAPREHSQ